MPRLAEIFERDQLPEDKRWVHDYLMQTRRKISNGFAPFLHCPEYVARVAQLGTYIRYESSLPKEGYELLALTTSVERGNPYEGDHHALILGEMGIERATLDAVRNQSGLEGVSEEDVAAAASKMGIADAVVREVLTSESQGTIADPTALLSRYIAVAEQLWAAVDGWRGRV